ncbi:murein hydrolase activator EnvC family protein [Sporolactobacillus terrae]|uniref:Murein DD-endopeptidase MepM n=1 Tax=Sporolactobacillus terrae TaxID=269673 RepID=A0A410D5K2_9BACL|nr:M23 family metallopeptidase [Sporolactobacillus terrae]QAA21374.1 murein DD-endopeptidase MepM [Sporolactobacillus terrae]QAA24346.1 murein DD-endopeptidase MepM [Sporolactobacillus terrae]UAK16167.1 peptidoglycan DD-metalloendopeptidase family protein [Sporolactobacillus terrae]BBN97622.1 peptidase M24 [Sporolactobacillus terrae]
MNRNYIHTAVALVLVLSLIMGYSVHDVHASDQQISENQQQQDGLINQLKQTDRHVKKIKADVTEKQENLAESREKSKWMKVEIERLNAQIDSRDKLLKKRFRAMYLNGGNMNYIDVLLGSESFGDFIDRMFALKTISDNDQKLLTAQKQDQANRAAQQEELAKEQKQLENGLTELNDLKEELLKKEADQRNQLTLLKKEASKIKEKEMEKDEEKDVSEAQTHALASENVSDSDAAFIKPAQGYISSGFGKRSFDNSFHPGIDIANSEGTPVQAAADGVVFRAYHSSSYGNAVMISHKFKGKLFTTVYAHLSSYEVATGERVAKGQVIGKMGNTGESFGSHLHFELYEGQWNPPPHNGAIDPMKFIQ